MISHADHWHAGADLSDLSHRPTYLMSGFEGRMRVGARSASARSMPGLYLSQEAALTYDHPASSFRTISAIPESTMVAPGTKLSFAIPRLAIVFEHAAITTPDA